MNMSVKLGEGAFGSAVEGKVPESGVAGAVTEGKPTEVDALAEIIEAGIEASRVDNAAMDMLAFQSQGGEVTYGATAGHDGPDRYKPAEDAPAMRP